MAFVTRFAPSPTGPLHLGHAYSALLAHDLAVAARGRFLLRIEDTDIERCRPEWEAQIYDDLHWLGLRWPEPVLRQSDRVAEYEVVLDSLAARGLVYPCSCSRADIRAAVSAPQEGVAKPGIYPGTCRHRTMATRLPGDALRLNMAAAVAAVALPLRYCDTGSEQPGWHEISAPGLIARHGDVVLGRKDIGTASYVLAAVLDDCHQQISDVIRGADLCEITEVQVLLQHLLGLPTPTYHHHHLIRDAQGKRLAKRCDARALSKYRGEGATPAEIRGMVGL
ncbi:tRNA glutamyl-Q(34) synthetase GluQRS [Pseudorhodobacter sp.]|uniref:tRNA glutamyl-Q(34) synthetase GluQRS n=1 Tax=Pseudorhodobacter sp. TaxID=1934400 RepID=UPI00264A4481|nr:tRNA glutamyl-Q(34) synthetase GluQRS [Pseudorhodobacter sp.]MDN5788497.1 tRNA glutamyl-Q(34) synthetase GluQRS [Pseudorhodobacter sp.]